MQTSRVAKCQTASAENRFSSKNQSRFSMSADKSLKVPTCNSNHSVDVDNLNLRQDALALEKAQEMAEFFRLLGDANRLRIISLLAKKDLCVCDLATILEMSESAVSHQLRTLRSLRLVSYTKRGRKVYYRLLDYHVLELYVRLVQYEITKNSI